VVPNTTVFMGLQYEICFISPSWRPEFRDFSLSFGKFVDAHSKVLSQSHSTGDTSYLFSVLKPAALCVCARARVCVLAGGRGGRFIPAPLLQALFGVSEYL
jgi:hypothetical protein